MNVGADLEQRNVLKTNAGKAADAGEQDSVRTSTTAYSAYY